jgi:hypothetical protein
MRRRLHLLFIVAAALTGAGCGKGAKGECPQLDICGGDPTSTTPWQVFDYCQVPVVRPSQPGDTNDFTAMTPPLAPTVAPPQPNAVVAQQTTSGDWCSSLVYTMDGKVTNANLWHEAPHISNDIANHPSTMIFAAPAAAGMPGTYLTKLVFEDQNATHFAHRCLIANGAINPKCSDLGTALAMFYKSGNPAVPDQFSGITCSDSPVDGGCDCSYTFNLQVDDLGTWALDPNDSTILLQDSTVLQFNGATMNAQASTTTLRSSLCAGNGSLELSGVRGGSLSNVQGLRTLGLRPMPMK